jgi:ribosomal protein S18 acetylase RimI-like enzyme
VNEISEISVASKISEVRFRAATVADASAIAALRVESWRATYRGVMPDAYLDNMHAEESAFMWAQVLAAKASGICVFVAEASVDTDADAEIVGFASGMLLTPEKLDCNAELTGIYIKPIAQRGGVGRRLVSLVAQRLQQSGAVSLLSWVISENQPARKFHEELGAELLVEQAFAWDGLDLLEVGYGWQDLDALLTKCEA